MACPFCGKPDNSYTLPDHFYKHQIDTLQRIAKALEGINDSLDEIRKLAGKKVEGP